METYNVTYYILLCFFKVFQRKIVKLLLEIKAILLDVGTVGSTEDGVDKYKTVEELEAFEKLIKEDKNEYKQLVRTGIPLMSEILGLLLIINEWIIMNK